MSTSRQVQIYVGLALALVVSNLGLSKLTQQIPALGPLWGREAFWWGLFAVVVLYVLFAESKKLSSIAIRRITWKTFVFGLLGGVVLSAGIPAIIFVVLPALHMQMDFNAAAKQLLNTPFWYRVALVTRAAVVEETLFRGYGIERITELTGNKWLAALVSWIAFTVAHISYWSAAGLLVAGFGGLVLTALYVWRRDLPTNIVAHWLADAGGFLLPH